MDSTSKVEITGGPHKGKVGIVQMELHAILIPGGHKTVRIEGTSNIEDIPLRWCKRVAEPLPRDEDEL